MGRGWYRRRHVNSDVCGHPGANPGGRFTLHILRGHCAARPDRSPFLTDEAAANVARPSATVPSFASSARFKNVIFARRN